MTKLIDEWIIGEGLEFPGHWYVIHTAAPRFIVQIRDSDDIANVGGQTWALRDDQIACNVVLYDAIQHREELDHMMFLLSDIIDDYDERVSRRIERNRDE